MQTTMQATDQGGRGPLQWGKGAVTGSFQSARGLEGLMWMKWRWDVEDGGQDVPGAGTTQTSLSRGCTGAANSCLCAFMTPLGKLRFR